MYVFVLVSILHLKVDDAEQEKIIKPKLSQKIMRYKIALKKLHHVNSSTISLL